MRQATETSTVRRIVSRTALQAVSHHYNPISVWKKVEEEELLFDRLPRNDEFRGAWPLLKKVLRYAMTGMFLVTISGVSYMILFRALMPPRCTAEPLYFDYSEPAPSSRGLAMAVSTQRKDGRGFLPWAYVDLFAKHNFEALIKEVMPSSTISGRLLRPSQAYYIDISLVLPETDANRRAGMFAVVSDLISHNNTVLATSRRSTRLPHESHWISVLRKLILAVPLLVGATTESRVVKIAAFRHFMESTEFPLQNIMVKVQKQFQPHSEVCAPEIIGGELLIGQEYNEIQEFLVVWYYTCYLIGTLSFVFFYGVQYYVTLALWDYWMQKLEPPCELNLERDSFHEFEYSVSPSVGEREGANCQDDTPPASAVREEDPEVSRFAPPPQHFFTTSAGGQFNADDDDDAWEELFQDVPPPISMNRTEY